MNKLLRKDAWLDEFFGDRYNLFRSFDSILDKVFHRTFPELFKGDIFESDMFSKTAFPKVDVVDKKTAFELAANVAGYEKKDISITVKENVLTIKGKKADEGNLDDKVHLIREIKRSSFSRSFILNDNCDVDNIKVSKFEKGMLYITIPKLHANDEPEKVINIEIE